MKKNKIVIIISLTTLLTSCSSDPTSEAKEIIADKVSVLSNGILKAVNIKKINGLQSNDEGIEKYIMDYTTEAEVVGDNAWAAVRARNIIKTTANPKMSDISIGDHFDRSYGWTTQLKKGNKYRLSDLGSNTFKLTIEKTENGWKESTIKFVN